MLETASCRIWKTLSSQVRNIVVSHEKHRHQVSQMWNIVKCQKWKTSSSVTYEKLRRATRELATHPVTQMWNIIKCHRWETSSCHRWETSSSVTDEKHRRVIDEKYRQVPEVENFVKCHGCKTSSSVTDVNHCQVSELSWCLPQPLWRVAITEDTLVTVQVLCISSR